MKKSSEYCVEDLVEVLVQRGVIPDTLEAREVAKIQIEETAREQVAKSVDKIIKKFFSLSSS